MGEHRLLELLLVDRLNSLELPFEKPRSMPAYAGRDVDARRLTFRSKLHRRPERLVTSHYSIVIEVKLAKQGVGAFERLIARDWREIRRDGAR
jgi:hypothetical protein